MGLQVNNKHVFMYTVCYMHVFLHKYSNTLKTWEGVSPGWLLPSWSRSRRSHHWCSAFSAAEQRCAEVHKGVQGCAKVCKCVQRCTNNVVCKRSGACIVHEERDDHIMVCTNVT